MTNAFSRFIFPALWLSAFLFSLFPLGSMALEIFAACIVTIFLWSYLTLYKGMNEGWALPKSPVLMLAGCFWLLALCSLFWSEAKPATLMTVCLFSIFPLTFFIGTIKGDEGAFRKIALALAPVFFGLGVWAVIQFFFLNSWVGGQARHPMADPSSLGALFSLALFCALGWLLYDDNKARKIIAALLCVSLFAAIMATVARGPVFAFVPGFALMVILLWPRVAKAKFYFLALVIAIAAILAIMGQSNAHKQMGDRIADTVTFKMDDISNKRTKLWESSVRMIEDAPWLGRGFGTYYLYLSEYKDPTYVAAAYHAHNDPLEFWVELGIMGPILFYAFLIAAALRTRKALKKLGPDNSRDRVIIVTTFCALLSMIVQSHVSFNLYIQPILLISGLLLAVWFTATGRYVDDKVALLRMPENSPRIVNMALLALPFLMIGGLFLSNIAGEHYTNKARDYLFNHKMDEFIANINRAGHVSQGMNYRSYILAVNVPLTILESEKSRLDLEARQKLFDQANGYMNRVIAINPRVDAAYYYKGKGLELAGADITNPEGKTAEDMYKETLRINPMHLGARLSLARLYKAEGRDKKEIYAVMEPGLSMYYLSPVAMSFYQEMATMYLTDGNYVKAREAMRQMVEFKKRMDKSAKRVNTTLPQALLSRDPLQ